jgi:hypothetical protein
VVTAYSGFAAGVVMYNVVFVYTNWPPSYFISVGGMGVIFVILWVLIKRGFVIVMFCLYGAYAIAFAIGVYLQNYFPFFIVDFSQPYYYVVPRNPIWVGF